jgi:hypothetical protein
MDLLANNTFGLFVVIVAPGFISMKIWGLIKKKIINPIPKAWDVFFRKQQPCFMMVHLKNGQIIGGLYAYASAASSYPEKEDLYLQELWELDDEGRFEKPIDGTMGLLVNNDSVDYIELFQYKEEGA